MKTPAPGQQYAFFVDRLSLAYHEARNVRHLIRAKYLSVEGWEKIISLPVNRNEAWESIQALREQAYETISATDAAKVFEKRFAVTLEELIRMYDNPNWRNAGAYGGNAWSKITKMVAELGKALDGEREGEAARLIDVLEDVSHNTGRLGDKLTRLDASLASRK